ncbi:MAG: hypothetical protein BWY83_02484 [bacterium ADurb.Bin478]|nr:MAG: hypothetical protein BWY83_02484 [bacterium ADurb.Bin478]
MGLGCRQIGDALFDHTTDDIELALELAQRHPPGCEKKLLYAGLRGFGQIAEMPVLGRHSAPSQHLSALLFSHLLDDAPALVCSGGMLRQKRHADGIVPGLRQIECGDLRAEQLIGDLQHEPGAVAGAGVAAHRAAVLQIDQRLQGQLHDLVTGDAVQPGEKTDSATVMFKSRIIQSVHGTG